MNILVVLKSPFLDKIPNLKALILDFCNRGDKVTLLCPKSEQYNVITSTHSNLSVRTIKQRSRKFEMPTLIKLLGAYLREISRKHYDLIIGGDAVGNIIASRLSWITRVPHIFFVLEYPQIIDAEHPVLSRLQIEENKALGKADYIITHDKWHEGFLRDNFSLKGSVFHLPNASYTPAFKDDSNYLREKFYIPADKALVLHSGGFMDVFRCKELMQSTKGWEDDKVMVFHASHKITENPYFIESRSGVDESQLRFSLNALDNETLDRMVASADVGIALYSVEKLGYRAELMGVAAGKIGNYLKCGVPVIATRLPSLQYLEDYECGFLIDDESEIPALVDKIKVNREYYRSNAYKCYEELWKLDGYLDIIYNKILMVN